MEWIKMAELLFMSLLIVKFVGLMNNICLLVLRRLKTDGYLGLLISFQEKLLSRLLMGLYQLLIFLLLVLELILTQTQLLDLVVLLKMKVILWKVSFISQVLFIQSYLHKESKLIQKLFEIITLILHVYLLITTKGSGTISIKKISMHHSLTLKFQQMHTLILTYGH